MIGDHRGVDPDRHLVFVTLENNHFGGSPFDVVKRAATVLEASNTVGATATR